MHCWEPDIYFFSVGNAAGNQLRTIGVTWGIGVQWHGHQTKYGVVFLILWAQQDLDKIFWTGTPQSNPGGG